MPEPKTKTKKPEIEYRTERDYLKFMDTQLKDPGFKTRYNELEIVLSDQLGQVKLALGEKFWKMFCIGVMRILDEHLSLTSADIISWIEKNTVAIDKIVDAIMKGSGKDSCQRMCPPNENYRPNVYFTVVSAIIVSNLYQIDPVILITLAAYENGFQSTQNRNSSATGIMQLLKNSSSIGEFQKEHWVKKTNKLLKEKGAYNIDDHNPHGYDLGTRHLEMFNPLLCTIEGARTLMLKTIQIRGIKYYTLLHSTWGDTKELYAAYNGGAGKDSYANDVSRYAIRFYGLDVNELAIQWRDNKAVPKKTELLPAD